MRKRASEDTKKAQLAKCTEYHYLGPSKLVRNMTKEYAPQHKQPTKNTEKDQYLSSRNITRILERLRKQKVHTKNHRLRNPYRHYRTNPSPNLPPPNLRPPQKLLHLHRLLKKPHRNNTRNQEDRGGEPECIVQVPLKEARVHQNRSNTKTYTVTCKVSKIKTTHTFPTIRLLRSISQYCKRGHSRSSSRETHQTMNDRHLVKVSRESDRSSQNSNEEHSENMQLLSAETIR